MRCSCITLFFVSIIVLGMPTSTPGQWLNPALLEEIAASEMRSAEIPGAAVAVIEGDTPVFLRGFGVAKVSGEESITPETVFQTGSVTKIFTAAALAVLAHQGRVDFHQPAGLYVEGLHPDLARLTLHQLLTHTAGLNDNEAPFAGVHDEEALAAGLKTWNETSILTSPGRIFSYANPGYSLAGLVIQSVTGKAFADAMHELLFEPLGLRHTTFRPSTAASEPLAIGHIASRGVTIALRRFANNVQYWPAGYLYSSAADLGRFVIALMNDGRLEGSQVLPSGILTTIAEPQVKPPTGIYQSYGYGIGMLEVNGVRAAGHDGAITGFSARLLMVPERRFAVIVLTNKHLSILGRTVQTVFQMAFPPQPRNGRERKALLPVTSEDIARHAGIYRHGPVRVEILEKDGRLVYKSASLELPMYKLDEARFAVLPPKSKTPTAIVFVSAEGGETVFLHRDMRAFIKVE